MDISAMVVAVASSAEGSARFPSMPISAIETGCVDFVLRPNEIAHKLAGQSCQAQHPHDLSDEEAILQPRTTDRRHQGEGRVPFRSRLSLTL